MTPVTGENASSAAVAGCHGSGSDGLVSVTWCLLVHVVSIIVHVPCKDCVR